MKNWIDCYYSPVLVLHYVPIGAVHKIRDAQGVRGVSKSVTKLLMGVKGLLGQRYGTRA